MDSVDSVELRGPLKKDELQRVLHKGELAAKAKPRAQQLSDRTREELIKLVQRLFFSPDPGPRVVVFSAVEPQAGCSWTCARIAEILADRTDGLVCLIDANFRSRTVYSEFHCENPARLADEEWTVVPVSRPGEITSNLWLLSYKPAATDCPTAGSLERFQKRIDDLRNDFNYVLLDAPPLKNSAEAALFGRMADGLVLVVEANNTRRETAKRAKHLLDESGVPVLGAVLNKRVFPIPEQLYRRL
jgi:Mrp family chromosome partitioning ATPase